MISIAESLNQFAADRARTLDDESKVEIHDVLDAAADFVAGLMPIHTFAKIGGIPSSTNGKPSPGYTRFMALMTTPTDDPRRAALLTAIDAVLSFQGVMLWERGIYERDAA